MDRQQDLVAAMLAGDEAVFSTLVERLHPRIVRLCRRFVATDAAAEDVAQDTWQAVLQGLPAFEGRSALATWILQIAINRARSRGASDARTRPLHVHAADGTTAPDDDGDGLSGRFHWYGAWKDPPRAAPTDTSPEAATANRELVRLVAAALDTLPEQQRLVVTLRDVETMTAAEVCAVLDISEENQRVLLHRGRARLRSVLDRHAETSPSPLAAVANGPTAVRRVTLRRVD